MENPDQSAIAEPSITSILKKISDDKTLVLFNSIAVSSNSDRYIPLKEMNMTTKQYYTRISGLIDAGLIKRHKGKYSLTLLGEVVYDTQMTIGKTLAYYWKLKAIESIQMSPGTSPPNEEITQLINALIDDHQIKDILMKSITVPSTKNNSKIQTQSDVVKQKQVEP